MKFLFFIFIGFLTSIILDRFFDFSFLIEMSILGIIIVIVYLTDKYLVKKKGSNDQVR
jgi:mannose/fructose/N-acetylgalactosamine-specific phosphotransferase system component IIC